MRDKYFDDLKKASEDRLRLNDVAPELLDILIMLERFDFGHGGDESIYNAICRKARATIKKATGQ